MAKKPLSFGETLQKRIDQINRKREKDLALYAEACRRQGVKVGEPVDIMALLGKKD